MVHCDNGLFPNSTFKLCGFPYFLTTPTFCVTKSKQNILTVSADLKMQQSRGPKQDRLGRWEVLKTHS